MHLSPTSKLGYLSFKMGSCVFQCDVPHQRIAHGMDYGSNKICLSLSLMGCHVLHLQYDIPVGQHIGQLPLLQASTLKTKNKTKLIIRKKNALT